MFDNFTSLLWPGLLAFGLTAVVTPLLLKLAKRYQLFDLPSSRRVHTQPIPRIGGIAIFLAVILGMLLWFGWDARIFGLGLGLTIVFLLGLFDDLYSLPAWFKVIVQFFAAAIVIMFGVTISNITNPFGGNILLPVWLDVILTVGWLLLVTNTVNWLDGLDGLAAGVSGIGALALVGISLLTIVNQPDTAKLAVIVAGASFGFLIFNWHPAKIFMGDSGSHVLGFMLAGLSIISGGKLATAALVLGLPILDLFWAVLRRLRAGKAPWVADKEHLHHLLLSLGLGQRLTVGLIYVLAAAFGLVALLAGTTLKLIMLGLLILVMAGIVSLALHFKRIKEGKA